MTSKRILITGATGAIGSALACAYAETGVSLCLHGRNEARLNEVADACRKQGAVVQTYSLDVRDVAALRAWLADLWEDAPIDLMIVNAGMNTHVMEDGRNEPWDEAEAVLDINLRATMAMCDELIPAMRARQAGQIALVSSLAAYYGLPMTPAYCATKAGVKAYGEALRGWLADSGVRINVIMPGYVTSKMCSEMPGPKPFLWTPERAARRISRGLARNEARITFPFPLDFGTWWLAVLPSAVSQWILRLLNYRA